MTNKKGKLYQGSEVIVTEFKMILQAYLIAFLLAFIFQLVTFVIILYLKGLIQPVVQNTAGYLVTWFAKDYFPHKLINFCSLSGECARFTVKEAYPLFVQNMSILWSYGIKQALFLSIASYFVTLPLIFKVFHAKAESINKERVLRGADLMPESKVAKTLPKPWRLPVSRKLSIPVTYETQHVLVAGKTGMGKTTLISQQLEKLRKDEIEKVIVYDFKGDYISKFYREGTDYIFNPLDQRCVRWSVFNDIRDDIDMAALAESLIPPSPIEQERYWRDGAQTVLISILKILREQGKTTNRDIWEFIPLPGFEMVQRLNKYRKLSAGAIQFLGNGENNQASGILSSLMEYAGIFEYMAESDGPFSLKEWLTSNKKGWLFIYNSPKAKNKIKPALSMIIDMLIREVLSLPDDSNRRVFFFIDEFATLQPLPSLIDFITLARSKGGVMVLGIQDLGRVQKLYGREETKTIINNTANHIIFGVVGETAEEFSKIIGEKEVTVVNQAINYGPTNIRDGMSSSINEQKKLVLLPSELASLKRFEIIVRFAEGQLTRTKIKKRFIKRVNKDINLTAEPIISNISKKPTEYQNNNDSKEKNSIMF